MDNKQILKREESENESVLYTSEELVDLFMGYYLLLGQEDTVADLRRAREAKELKLIDRIFSSRKNISKEDIKEAVALTTYGEDTPLWERFGDTPEAATQVLASSLTDRAEDFIESRYSLLCSAFLNYLEPMLLVGMRTGLLQNSWWRAYNYGFSVEPYTVKGEESTPNAFPYTSVEEMTEADKRAFLWTVEDTLHSIIGRTLIRTLTQPAKEAEEEGREIKPYPEQGYKAEEIARRASYKDDVIQPSELYDSWEWDIELYLPVIINRLDEAIYYAIKYRGAEYKDYIQSLNVEKDYNLNLGNFEEYNKAMKEGYVWHWVE